MDALAPVIFVMLFASVLGLMAWLLISTVRRNRAPRAPAGSAEFERLAAAKGWQYHSRADNFLRRFHGYPFSGAGARPALDLVTGTHRGRDFVCFQYSLPRSVQPGEHPVAIDYARVVALSLPMLDSAPTVVLAPAGSPRWTRRYTVGDDVFDRMFAVGSEDTGFANQFLTEPLRRWLIDHPPLGSLRIGGGYLLWWRPDRADFDSQLVEPTLDWLCDLADRLPPNA
jgi:hypothetical protein